MTYCPPNHTPQEHEFTALTGADILASGDHELSYGDCFTMPVGATACITAWDDDGSLSGDAWCNEWGDDRSYQTADIVVGGETLHDGVRIYAEEYYVLHGDDGRCYYLIEIEVAGEHVSDQGDFYAFYGDVPPAGVTLTVAGKGNVKGDWLDYRDLSAGLKWDLDDNGKLTVEAEDMALRGYKVDDVHAASGGEVIRLKRDTGTANVTFGAESGTYDMELAYIDENDGEGTIEVWVNDTLVQTIALTANNNGNGNDWSTISTVTITDLELSQGDEITLKGIGDAWEMARIDALTFCAKTNAPPEAVDDFYMVAETSSTVLDILANDGDPDGDDLTLTLLTQPVEGTVSVNDAGEVVFETGADFAGLWDGQSATVSFVYEISDGDLTDTATVTVAGEGAVPDETVVQTTVSPDPDDPITVTLETPETPTPDGSDFDISVDFGDLTADQFNFVFVVDVSLSTGLADSFAPGVTVLEAQVAALKTLTDEIMDLNIAEGNATISIIPFSSPDATPTGLFPVYTFGDDEALNADDVDAVLDGLTAAGETNYLAAVGAATDAVLNLEATLGDANNQVYFLSDGDPTPPGSQPAPTIDFFATTLKSEATVHALGLGTDVSTEFLDPIDNTGGAEIVVDTAALDVALAQAPGEAETILSAQLVLTDETGTVVDTFDFVGSDFEETPLGYALTIEDVTSLGLVVGETTEAELTVALDRNFDSVADDVVTVGVDIDGLLPVSTDL